MYPLRLGLSTVVDARDLLILPQSPQRKVAYFCVCVV